MIQVTHEAVVAHQGSLTTGPIPAGVDPVAFATSHEGHSFCIHLFDKPKKGQQYPMVQGTFWVLRD